MIAGKVWTAPGWRTVAFPVDLVDVIAEAACKRSFDRLRRAGNALVAGS